MLNALRPFFARLLTPVGQALARTPVTPNAITVTGTLGVAAGALALFPTGHLFAGTLVCWGFAMSDMLDGLLARVKGTTGTWGAFLDSTLDRVGDAAVFAGLAIWLARGGHSRCWRGWRCTAWWPARWCRTPRPGPRAWGCAATWASPSAPSGC